MSIVAKKIMMGSGAVALPSDSEFNRTSFLSHFDGTNNGVNSVFDDGSASNHTITANGNVSQGSFGPFARPDGEWAVSFDGTGDYFEVSNPTSSAFGTGDFTLECWVYMAVDNTNKAIVETRASDLSANGFVFAIEANGGRKLMVYSNAKLFTTSNAISLNTWTHIAISRSGTTLKCFINGTQGASVTNSQNYTNALVRVGRGIYASSDFNGLISNLRLVNSAVYTSNFTPPTAALTAITNTKLLACQSNRFVDNSASALTITPAGNAAVTAFGPFLTDAVYDPAVNGASAYFDGSGESLVVDATVISQSGNFTFEGWAYSNSTASQTIGGQYSGGGTGRMVIYSGSGNIRFYQNASPAISYDGSSGKLLNQWCHFVLMRTGSNIALYINGVRVLNATAKNIEQSDFIVGAENSSGNNSMNGYISNIRCTSSAVYSEGTSITVPTAPYSTVTNTNLLLNMADGQAIDSAAQNNLTLVGTAKTSTAQKLFGTASLLLDGNSDLVTFPSEAGLYGSGNFTIEFSFRLAANVGDTPFVAIAKWETSGNQRSWMVRIDNVSSANKIKFFDSANGSSNTSSTFATSFSNETWYKIAVVNVSGTVSMYVNGTADSTTHSLATGAPYASTSLVSIGANIPSSPSQFFNGNIDDVRLSKFARYTGNYTAQSEPFPDEGK